MKIVFATNNSNKLAEIQQALGKDFELVSLKDIGFEGDIPETTGTLEGNALQKATFIYERYRLPVFSDDTGLLVDCLGGLPGVDTAHYSGSRDADANMAKLLDAVDGCEDRSAAFKTFIAFVTDSGHQLFEGEIRGRIASEKSGEKGFGYDPIFVPEGETRTFAEMTIAEKAQKNHRVRAFRKFVDYLREAY
jgi:XTP/dITP diphosphohydrolase